MKKGIIFVAAVALLGGQVMAQDVIYFNNGSQQKAKVSEVRVDEIVYKKTENLNGPVYTTKKSEVQMIEFSNGYKETFTALNNNNNGNNYTSNTPQSYNNNNSGNQQPQNSRTSGRTTYETNNYYTSNGQVRPNVNVNIGGGGYYGGGWNGWGGGYYRPVYYNNSGWGWGGGWGGYHHGGCGGGYHHHHR